MKVLPDYNPNAKCPVCGHDEISTFYCIDYCKFHAASSEHVDRRCKRCHYKWPEKLIDFKWLNK